jgi:hypothetical protein
LPLLTSQKKSPGVVGVKETTARILSETLYSFGMKGDDKERRKYIQNTIKKGEKTFISKVDQK